MKAIVKFTAGDVVKKYVINYDDNAELVEKASGAGLIDSRDTVDSLMVKIIQKEAYRRIGLPLTKSAQEKESAKGSVDGEDGLEAIEL